MNQTVEELAYVISVKTDNFLNGKRQVEQAASEMSQKLQRSAKDSSDGIEKTAISLDMFAEKGKAAFGGLQMGAAKFLGVALTLEASRRIFASTTTDLVRLGNVSSFLGISATGLQGYERAARAVGVSSQSMGSSLAKVKNAQLWARTGMGAPDESTVAIQQLQGMTGVDIIGAKDPGQGLNRQAEALRKLNKDQAQVMWQRMGGQDDMFNLMYSGNLATLQKQFEQQSNATPAAIKQAMDVTETLEKLKASADGLAQEFVRIFGKDINEAMTEFSDWVKNNEDNIVGFFQDGAKWAKEFADALNGSSNAMHAFFQITDNFNLLSGFNKPVIDLSGPEALPEGTATTAGGNIVAGSRMGQAWDYVAGKWKQKEAGKAQYNKRQGLTPGATNPEAAYPQERQSNDWFSDFLRSVGIGSAGAASMSPTLSGSAAVMTSGQVDAQLMDALMMTESGGNPLARNMRSGATGAYQFMAGTARDMGLKVGNGVDERLDPEKSRAAASMYMSQLLKRYGGNVDYALKAYNWGMGNMDAYLKTGRGASGQEMPQETKNYSGRVAGYYRRMANGAMMPGSSASNVDNSQASTTNIQTVNVQTTPQTVDQLSSAINEQVQRSHVTVSFAGANNPS